MKHQTHNRILSFFLALVMLCTSAPFPVLSEETTALSTAVTVPFDSKVTFEVPNSGGATTSNSYRIPAMVTLKDGTMVAAADIRWNTTYDGGGLDTLVARSTDGGVTWEYSVANYLGDNGNVYNGSSSTAFIDPCLTVAADGQTLYMLCDLYPYGVSLNGLWVNNVATFASPSTDVGFTDEGYLRLSNNSHQSYDYYLKDGKIYSSADGEVENYTVDEYFNLYHNGAIISNLFFQNSPYQVVRTGYLYLTKSTDGGETWSAPTLLDLKTSSEWVCLVGPGRGITTVDGTMVFPVYSYSGSQDTQRLGFVYSTDGGSTWKRENSTVSWSSEAAVVEIDTGTLRFFYRNGTTNLCYVDYDLNTRSWGTAVTTTVDTNSNTQLSAITYSKTVDGKQVVLVSCPTGPNGTGSDSSDGSYRTNGKIFVFSIDADGTMTLVKTIDVTENIATGQITGTDSIYTEEKGFFAYSCLTERSDGSIAVLYENSQNGWGAGTSTYYTMNMKAYTATALDADFDEITEKEISLFVASGDAYTLNPMTNLGLTGAGYTVTYTTEDVDQVISLEGDTVTAAENVEGEATVTATVTNANGTVVGTVEYTITVAAYEIKDEKNIFIPVGGKAEIEGLVGEINKDMLDPDVASIKPEVDALTTEDLVISGLIEGDTAVIVGNVRINIHVVPNNVEDTKYPDYAKYIYIYISEIKNCKVYYAINGSTLYEVEKSGVLIDQTYSDGFNIIFFTAPVGDDYVLSKMTSKEVLSDNSEKTLDDFFSLSDGTQADGSGSAAWPLESPDATDVPAQDSDGWKDVGTGTNNHGFKWALLQGNMTLDDMRALFTAALAEGCDGATTITKNEQSGVRVYFSFVAEGLPTFEKSLILVNGEQYDGNTELNFGDEVTYQFTINTTSEYVNYSNVKIADDLIGYSGGIVDLVDADGASVTSIDTAGTYYATATYTINENDLDKYTGGIFENDATLGYTYSSKFATGTEEAESTASVSCKINGIVSYTWQEGLPTEIIDKYTLPQQQKVEYNTEFVVDTTSQAPFIETDENGKEKGTWTFDGWYYDSDENGQPEKYTSGDTLTMPTNASVELVGKWTFELAKYTVTWKNDDGTVLETDTDAEYGTVPTYDGEEPTKAATAQYTYTFVGWTPDVDEVTDHITYIATYTSIVNAYTITWVDEDGTVLETDENVPYGDPPDYNGEAPTKSATAQYTYTFAGWTPNVDEVTGNVTYTATYTETVNKYTIQFVNENGTELQSSEVEYGAMPSYSGATPIKAATAEFSYSFAGWDKEIVTVTGDATYTATYSSTTNTYTVTWKNEDGTVLETDTDVPYGTAPSYDGTTPTKAADAQYTYTFSGWSPAIEAVTGNVTYTASFEPTVQTYTIIWKNEDGTVLETDENVPYGTMPSYDSAEPTKVSTAQYSYTFAGWTPNVSLVTGKAEYTATFTETVRSYTVIWQGDDGTQLEIDENVQYGATPSYNGATPTKAADAQYIYTFAGWTPEVSAVTGDVTYKATFTEAPRTYTITWVDGDGNTIKTEQVPYGETPEYEGITPTKTPTAQYTYTHDGWTPEIEAVAGDATYTATFTFTVNTYTVIWQNWDGEILETDSNAPYGEMPKCDYGTPSRAPDENDPWHVWEFSGWTPEVASVTGNVIYIATYEKVNSKVFIGVNLAYYQTNSNYNYYIAEDQNVKKSSYHKLPDEPYKLHDIELWRAHVSNGEWVIDKNWNQAYGDAEKYIDKSILNDTENYKINYAASGVTDPEGNLVKKYFKFSSDEAADEAVYNAILKAWLDITFSDGNMEIKWEKVFPENCVIIPYVVKRQDNGHWYVDMIVIVETTPLTIHAPDIPDSEEDQMFLFKITSPNHEGFELIVAVPEGGSVTINELYNAKTYVVTELTGWSWRSGDSPGWKFVKDADAQGDTGCTGTGAAAEIVLSATGNELTFTNTLDDPGWLGNENHKDNDFGTYDSGT